MNKIIIPQAVEEVLNRLTSNGEEAYIVGGCVRDSIMGKIPKDWDITTSATPMRIKEIFQRTVDTGIKHGTVTVLHLREAVEVTTFRVDGKYEDHRRPKEVSFTKSLKEDVARRDFTVNAMAYSPQTGLMDYFEGQEDLKKRLIRCVGEAGERFEEDALRMMRAVRFAAVLNFEIEALTEKAIVEKKDLIQAVSWERIRIEFVKTLASDYPQFLANFVRYGLWPFFLSEVALPENREDAFYQNLSSLPAEGYSRLSYLFLRMGRGEAVAAKGKKILKRMTFDNHTIQVVKTVIENATLTIEYDDYFFRKLLSKLGEEVAEVLLEIATIEQATDKALAKVYMQRAKTMPLRISDLEVDGSDVMQCGIREGKAVGECLNQLLELVLKHPEKNTKQDLTEWIKEHF